MKSSYLKKDLTYGDIISSMVLMKKPKKITEFGILDGYSLSCFIENSNEKTDIEAYDIFEDFNGNSSERKIMEKFSDRENVKIKYGDFYQKYKDLDNESIDILHIDIANNGEVYRFAIEHYMEKVKKEGIIILEGGSKKRDEVDWMKKFNKPSIQLFLRTLNLKFKTFGEFPSVTVIFK